MYFPVPKSQLVDRNQSDSRNLVEYVVPNDNQENERLSIIPTIYRERGHLIANFASDLQHQMFDLTFKGKLQLAPIDGLSVHQALDVGTGTGIWAIDFGNNIQLRKLSWKLIGLQLMITPKLMYVGCSYRECISEGTALISPLV